MVVAATGFFDGVHLGHKAVVDRMRSIAVSGGGTSLIVTFWPHPRTVLEGTGSVRLLTTLEEKTSLLQVYGVDRVEVLPFSRDFSLLSAEDFIGGWLRDRLGVDVLVVGYDHRLGHDKFDSVESMMAVISRCGITPVKVDELSADACSVSSTRIRNCLAEGDVDSAASLLGYRYNMCGKLYEDGDRTVLIPSSAEKLIPSDGEYIVEVNGTRLKCVVSGGVVSFHHNSGHPPVCNEYVCVEF